MSETPGSAAASPKVDGQLLRRLVFWSATATAVFAALSFAIAVTTPPRTGPFAPPATALVYPYSSAARFVPRDFIWMYVALVMMLAYLVLSVCLREISAGDDRVAGTAGLSLAVVSFTVIGIDYFIQLYTVQPALLKEEGASVVALTQYNPHGVFISLENLGFLAMALSFAAFAFTLGLSRLEHATRWVLLVSAALTAISFLGMSLFFGFDIEYRFEVTVIAVDWFTLMVAGVMIALVFAKRHA